jgi:flagellar biosynthesis GTPase FlhF
MGYSTRNAGTQILIFRTNNIPAPEFSAAYGPGGQSTLVFRGLASNPTPKEQLAIINLNALAKDSPAMSLWTKKDRLIKDIEVGTYCNLAVEIVKIYDTGGDSVDLYVTDYTTNKDLYLYEDPKYADRWSSGNVSRWNGPYGQVTLAVRAWEPHTRVARSVQVGDVVMLTNVHIKMSRELKVEGALHQDQRFPDKVQITKIYNRDQITALNRRKEDFYNARSRPPANPPRKSGTKRAAKKKEEKKAREREEKEAEQRRIEKHLEEEAAKRGNINAHSKQAASTSHGIELTDSSSPSPGFFQGDKALNMQ